MKPPPNLHELVRYCTVKLGATGGTGYGTGFFVAPGLILTCDHVVEGMRGKQIDALWQQQNYPAIIEQRSEDPQVDLALLRLEHFFPDHPCVLLDDSIRSRDLLYFYGYSDYHSNGDPVTVDCEGMTGDEPSLIKFKAGQVRPGLSGSPLLNECTGKVCGIIKFTRDRTSDLGGGAVPTSVILSQFKELTELQQAFHQQDGRWIESLRQSIIVRDKDLRPTPYGDVVHNVSREPSPKPCHPVFKLRSSFPRLSSFPELLDRQQEHSGALVALQNRRSTEVYSQQGWGKTTLLESLADRCQSDALFPDGIVYVPLGERQFAEDLLQLLFDCLYESDPPVKAKGQILRHLQPRQALIVLDDVQLTKDELKNLMIVMPGCTFLLAELERQLLGENVHALKLSGLPLPDALKLMERGLGRSLTAAEQPAAESLWTTLQGHPARILQAVGMVDEERSLASIVHQTQFETLTQQILAFLQEHQRSIIATLAALGGVALLAKQAAAITGIPDAEPVLETLVQRHLVQVDGPRYRLASNLVEDLQQLDLNPWRERALDYFTTWAEQHQGLLPHLLEEQDAILKVLDWAVMQGRWREVLSLVRLVEGALMVSGQWSAWEQVLERGLQAAQAIGDPFAEAWALHQLGTRALCLEDTDTAGNFLNQALRQREFLGDEMGAAVTRHNLKLLSVPVPPSRHDPESPPPRSINPKLLWFAGTLSTLLLAAGGWLIWGLLKLPQPPTRFPVDHPSQTEVTSTAPVTPPPQTEVKQPTDFSVVPLSQTEVALTWKDNSSNETGFRIERLGTGGEFKKISQVKADETASKDGNLSPNTTYTYRVGAIARDGKLSYSEEKSVKLPDRPVPPPAPVELSARAVSQSQIGLAWIDKSAGSFQFKIERSTDGGKLFSEIAVVPPGEAIYADKQLQANTTYHYRVRATNAIGDSEYSNIANVTTLPFPSPKLEVSDSSLNFGELPVSNSSQEQSITLTNKGNIPIKNLNIERIGEH